MANTPSFSFNLLNRLSILIFLYPSLVSCECTADVESLRLSRQEATKYKVASIASLLVAGSLGVSLPLIGKKIHALKPENDTFFMIKAFAAGVILCTGFVHILPDAFNSLSSPCLDKQPWESFPFAGFVSMMSAIATLLIDTFAAEHYKRQHFNKPKQASVNDEELADEHAGHVHVHTHATHGHAHGSTASPPGELSTSELIRRRIVSQVLELGILFHSLIIGVSLGTSQSPETIRPLLAALSFHQFFEGLGLGGCISEAQFKSRSTAIMAIFFSLTTPVGIGIGIGISSVYNENSSEALIVAGIFNSASAGILIYMALVDLLAADFTNPRLQSNVKLQLGANVSLLLGAACMSVLAKWA